MIQRNGARKEYKVPAETLGQRKSNKETKTKRPISSNESIIDMNRELIIRVGVILMLNGENVVTVHSKS